MTIIEISTLENGAHRNQIGNMCTIPDGWAVIPESMETKNFPFGTITADDTLDPKVVTSWEPLPVPEPEPEPEPEPTTDEILNVLLGVNV